MNLAPSSLRNRLVLGAAGVGLVFAVVFGIVASWRVTHAEDRAIRASLASRLDLARDEVAADGSIRQDAGKPQTDLVQVLGPDGDVRASTPALSEVGPLADIAAVSASKRGIETRLTTQRPDADLAILAVPVELDSKGSSPAGTGSLIVALDIEGFTSATRNLVPVLVAGLAAVVLAITTLAWVFTGRALRTVARITEDAEAVSTNDLGAGLPVPPRDTELARLVEALNRMLARLHQSHATELAFAADAGHRLRTPVATLRAEAELALSETDPAEVTAALHRVVHDADQLASIVDRMLARNRAHRPPAEPVRTTLDEAAVRWHRQARLADVKLTVDVDELVPREARTVQLLDVLEPIVENALRHTPADGMVKIRALLAPDAPATLLVSISNTGKAVPPHLVERLFDAWVSGRDASIAGGLGLWLARETARDTGGDIELLDTPSATVFEVRLPLVD